MTQSTNMVGVEYLNVSFFTVLFQFRNTFVYITHGLKPKKDLPLLVCVCVCLELYSVFPCMSNRHKMPIPSYTFQRAVRFTKF